MTTPHQPKAKVEYCCGWCGHPTDSKGKCIKPPEGWTHKDSPDIKQVNGECCPYGDGSGYE